MMNKIFAVGLTLCGLALQAKAEVQLKSVVLKDENGDAGSIAYGGKGQVDFRVSGYEDGTVEESALQAQGKVVIQLTRKDEDGTDVVVACKLFATKTQACACNDTVVSATFEKFPLCVTPGTYRIKLSIPSLDATLAEPLFSENFEVKVSEAPCAAGYDNDENNNQEPGCAPCAVGKYRAGTAADDYCENCPTGDSTWDRGRTSASDCETLPDQKHKFIAFYQSFFMLSNAGGQSLEAQDGVSKEECVIKCAQDPGCKAFDAGNDDNTKGSTYQRGNCFLSYDTEETIKERDVRSVSQLMLYRKVDAVDVRNVFFRRTVDGYIEGRDSGGVFRNEHSPDACAQLCLDDINCKSFDAGRQFAVRWEADVGRGKEWQPHIDNCYLSYGTKATSAKEQWIEPKCDGKGYQGTDKPLDKDCGNTDVNGIDYYERIIPQFVTFDVQYKELVNPVYPEWTNPLMPVQEVRTTQPTGDTTTGTTTTVTTVGSNDDAYSNDYAYNDYDGYYSYDDDTGLTGPIEEFSRPDHTYDAPERYRSESTTPWKNLNSEVIDRYPHVATRAAMADQVTDWAKTLVARYGGDTSVAMFSIIEEGKDGKVVAHINTGSDANDAALNSALQVVGDGPKFACPKLWDACTYTASSVPSVAKVSAKDMKCPFGSASASGFGQGPACVVCGVDRYPNGAQTDCTLCPVGTGTKPGARAKGTAAKEGERQCLVSESQTEAKKGSFRKGYEWFGTFATPLGAEGKGKWAQGEMTATVVEANFDDEDPSKVRIVVFIEARHGEDCNRDRKATSTAICDRSDGTGKCCISSTDYTTPVSCNSTDVDKDSAQCFNSDCSCRDPGLTSYYVGGYVTKYGTDEIKLQPCGGSTTEVTPGTATSCGRQTLYSGITDRNDWLYVPRGFYGKVRIIDGNNVIQGKFETPTQNPGNSVGPSKIEVRDYDESANVRTCNTDNFQYCEEAGFVKLTERCYASTEAGTFSKGDAFVGTYTCYRPGTNMRVTGLNKQPVVTVRQFDVKVTKVIIDDASGVSTVTAEVLMGFGSDGSSTGEGRYLAEGAYDAVRNSVDLIPVQDGWLTERPNSVVARRITGSLVQEGELVIGSIQANPHCACKTRCAGRPSYGDAKCQVDRKCSEAIASFGDASVFEAPCDEATRFGEESRGYVEECTKVSLARICQTPEPVCEAGWTFFEEAERCYKYEKEPLTYSAAEEACKAEDAHLASIHGATENTHVGDMALDARTQSEGEFIWIGLTVNEERLPEWLDETPFTFKGHSRSMGQPVGPCGALKLGGRAPNWQTSEITDKNGTASCDTTKLPFVCKKAAPGQLSPCSCSGKADANHHGGHCKSWSPDDVTWSGAWCYVAKNCGRAVKGSTSGYFQATCVDPDATQPPTTAPVTTKYPSTGDTCAAGNFVSDSSGTCSKCKTCPSDKISSSVFGDVCGEVGTDGEINPNLREHDLTCCTKYADKIVSCATEKPAKQASSTDSCRGGKDFTCETCQAGTFYPVNKRECKDAAKAYANKDICMCQPCDVTCSTCDTFAGKCTTCAPNLFLKTGSRIDECTSDCDAEATAGKARKWFGQADTQTCARCKTIAQDCPGGKVAVPCGPSTDTTFSGNCETTTLTTVSTTTVTTVTATSTSTSTSSTSSTSTSTSTTTSSSTSTSTSTSTTTSSSTSTYVPATCDGFKEDAGCGTTFRKTMCNQKGTADACPVMCNLACSTTSTTATTTTSTTSTSSSTSTSTSTTTTTATSTSVTTLHRDAVLIDCVDSTADKCSEDHFNFLIAGYTTNGNQAETDTEIKCPVACTKKEAKGLAVEQMLKAGWTVPQLIKAGASKFALADGGCDSDCQRGGNAVVNESTSTDNTAGAGSVGIIVGVLVVVLIVIGGAIYYVKMSSGSASAAKAGVTSFENPMYDTSGASGGAHMGGSGETSGYSAEPQYALAGQTAEPQYDVAGQTSGYMDVGGSNTESGGYMDVNPTAPGRDSGGASGYMDVQGGSNYIDDESEEDV